MACAEIGVSAGDSEELSVAGLLHNVGELALASEFPEEFAAAKDPAESFGVRYEAAGATLLSGWRLPEDIVQATLRIARAVREGRLDPEAIDEAAVAESLGTAGFPDPDLLIRTSGEMRISNFFLWQIAYTELYVTDTLWPDFREAEFLGALAHYQQRERRFGRTGAQQQGERAGAAR